MGRPKKLRGEPHPVHIVLPAELVAELDAWVDEARVALPGGSGITRADLIRDLLHNALSERRQARPARLPPASYRDEIAAFVNDPEGAAAARPPSKTRAEEARRLVQELQPSSAPTKRRARGAKG